VIATEQLGANQSTGGVRRALSALLLLALVIGAFALWVGVPAGVLWVIGKLVSDPSEHLVLGLIAVPLGMVLFGLLLATVNTVYLRINGMTFPADDDDEWTPRLRGPLDRIIGISAVICLLAFLAWVLLGSGSVGPAGP
jgi:hypothetical protein